MKACVISPLSVFLFPFPGFTSTRRLFVAPGAPVLGFIWFVCLLVCLGLNVPPTAKVIPICHLNTLKYHYT